LLAFWARRKGSGRPAACPIRIRPSADLAANTARALAVADLVRQAGLPEERIGVAGFGLSIIFFALSRNFYLSFVLLMFSGMFDNISVIIRSTTLQLITPDEMRGRVASVNSIFIGSSNEIGSFESGVAAKLMGLIPSVIFGGGMTLLIVGLTAKFAPLLRRLNLKNLS